MRWDSRKSRQRTIIPSPDERQTMPISEPTTKTTPWKAQTTTRDTKYTTWVHSMRSQNQPLYHISTSIRPQTQAFRPDKIPKGPWPRKQNTTPTRIHPQRLRPQRTHYQAAIPQPKRRNRPPIYWKFLKHFILSINCIQKTWRGDDLTRYRLTLII